MRAFIIFSGQAANHSNQNLQGADHTIKLSWVAVQATKLICEVSNIIDIILSTDWDWTQHHVVHSSNTLSCVHSVLRLTAGRLNTTNTLASHIQSTFCWTSPASTSCLQFTLSFHSNRKMAILWREVGILAIMSHTRLLQYIQALCSEFWYKFCCTSQDCLKRPAVFFVLQDNIITCWLKW